MSTSNAGRPLARKAVDHDAPGTARITLAVRIAEEKGLLAGPKTMHINAKISPELFQAAAKRIGTTSPAAVITAALAALATESDLGPWLAQNWGILADLPKEILDEIDL